MRTKEPIIVFKDVTKVYTLYKDNKAQFIALFYKGKYNKNKQHKALSDVSFEIGKGEAVGIVGKNGAGKSTLLSIITGVTFQTEGEVTVNGRVAALLELTAGFSAEMTGRENIFLKCYLLGIPEKDIKNIEPDIIEFADLGEYIDQPVRTYSSGMKMRLGFAININTNPDILVIDEALSVGDANFKEKCQLKIKELIEGDTTVIFVSHSVKSVKDICTRAIYLKNGKVMFDGDVDVALEKYSKSENAKPAKKKGLSN